MESTTKVVTGKVRFCYVNVFEPRESSEGETPKYSVCILIPKDDTATIDKINKAIEAAKRAGQSRLADNKGRIPSNIRLPLRDGDADRPDDPAYENMMFLNANTIRKPAIVDKNLNPILEREEFYSGCWGHASINFFAYNTSNSKGIGVGLLALQKTKDDEPLSGAYTNVEEDFGGIKDDDDDDLG